MRASAYAFVLAMALGLNPSVGASANDAAAVHELASDPGKLLQVTVTPGPDPLRVTVAGAGATYSVDIDEEDFGIGYFVLKPTGKVVEVSIVSTDAVLNQPAYEIRSRSVPADDRRDLLTGPDTANLSGTAHAERARRWEALDEPELALSEWFQAGSHDYYASAHDDALDAFRRAGETARSLGMRAQVAWAQWWRGVIERELESSASALEAFCGGLRALGWVGPECVPSAVTPNAIGLRIGLLLTNEIGLTHHFVEELDVAEAWYQRVLDLSITHYSWEYQRAITTNNLGGLAFQQGKYELARERFRSGLAVHEKRRELEAELNSLSNIALASEKLGELDAALESYARAVAIGEQIARPSAESHMLLRFGSLNRRIGRLGRAQQVAERALALAQTDSDASGIRQADFLLGEIALERGDLAAAQTYFESAYAAAQRDGDNGDIVRGNARLAAVALQAGDPVLAASRVARALDAAQRVGLESELAGLRLMSAHVASARGEAARAERELAVVRKASAATPAEFAEASLALARLVASDDPGAAAEYLDQAENRLVEWQQHVTDPFMEADVGELDARLHEERIGEHMDRFATSRDRAELVAALIESDYAKGRVLARLREFRRVAPAQGAELVNQIAALMSVPNPTDADRARLAQLQLELDLAGVSAERGPERRLERLPELGDGKAALVFEVGTRESYGWLIRDSGIEFAVLPPRAELEPLVTGAVGALRSRGGDPAAVVALSRAVLGGFEGPFDAEVLYVAPDEALHLVPFAALPLPDDPNRRIIASTTVVNVPNLRAIGNLPRAVPMNRLLAVGDTRYSAAAVEPTFGALPTLPGARRELAALGERFGTARTRILSGEEATRRAFLDTVNDGYDVVHVAAHGIVDPRFPELSGLMLSTVDAQDRPVSGFVSAREIATTPVKVGLVVLSACDSGVGRSTSSEGPLSLSWGFLAAGAGQVVASLWTVPDRSTSDLMTVFYGELSRPGSDPARALRAAQLKLMERPSRRDPSHWAAFVLAGT